MVSFYDEIKERMDEGEHYELPGTEVEREVIDQRRWHDRHRVVVGQGDEFYAIEFNTGSTEYQEDTDLDYKIYEVRPQTYVGVKYVAL